MAHAWKNLPLLEALRPDYGWHVERAILATYSADLSVVLAVLLALSGRDNDHGSASKVDVAATLDQLRGRVNFLFQTGRLSSSASRSAILAVLDSYLSGVDYDERDSSWHPKVALVRYRDAEGALAHRLWIGSKNLTKDLSWDTGLLLTSTLGKNGTYIPGIVEMAEELAKRANLKKPERTLLVQGVSSVRWQSPPGVSIEDLQLRLPGPRVWPQDPGGVEKLVIVSPFLDGEAVRHFGRWGSSSTTRVLVSTQLALSKLATLTGQPLKAFRCLSLDAPEDEATAALALAATSQMTPGDPPARDHLESSDPEAESEPEARGLHAKMILACHGENSTLWMGSANCTARAFGGNAEVLAKLAVSKEVAIGVDAFISLASPVNWATLSAPPVEEEDRQRLEETRQRITAAWSAKQSPQNSNLGPLLVLNESLPAWDEDIRLEVALLACQWIVWPQQAQQLELPRIEARQVTELVQLRLTLGELTCTWLQRATLSPAPGEERDRAALAHFLGPKAFLLWMRSLLSPDAASELAEWDEAENASFTRLGSGLGTTDLRLAPSLEEILRAWTRSPETIRAVDDQVKRYLPLLKAQVVSTESPELEQFLEFQATWQLIKQQLLS